MAKKFFSRMYENASELNRRNLVSMARLAGGTALLDLGCDDGSWTRTLGEKIGTSDLHGVEVVAERARLAEQNGVRVALLDLNQPLTTVPSGSFDVVHANQVIEHVANVDLFVSEIFRVLKPGGWAVVSTENGSSWHNIAAAIMGWQIFSSTNVSSLKAGLGNPLAIQRGSDPFMATWTHKTILNYRGLIELFQVHGFRDVKVAGAGYFPLPAVLGRLDPRHSAFITAASRK